MPVNSRPQHSCLFGSVLHKKSNNCGKAEQKAVSRPWLMFAHTSHTNNTNMHIVLGPVGTELSFPISHSMPYRMLYLYRAFDLLRLGALTLQLCEPQSAAAVSRFLPLPRFSFIVSLMEIQPRDLLASSLSFLFFTPELCSSSSFILIFFSFRLLDLTLPLSSHQRRPWLW